MNSISPGPKREPAIASSLEVLTKHLAELRDTAELMCNRLALVCRPESPCIPCTKDGPAGEAQAPMTERITGLSAQSLRINALLRDAMDRLEV